MFVSRLIQRSQLSKTIRQFNSTVRQFNTTKNVRDDKPMPSKPSANKSMSDAELTQSVIGTRMYHVTNFDRWLLVWVKRYRTKAEVPDKVTVECILQARSKARIRTCNIMIVLTIIGCLYSVLTGKKEAEAGHGILYQRQKWLEESNRKAAAEAAAEAAAKQ